MNPVAYFLDLLKLNTFEFTPEQSQSLYVQIISTIGMGSCFIVKDQQQAYKEAAKYAEFITLFKAKADIMEALNVGFNYQDVEDFKNRLTEAVISIREY